MIMNFLIPFCNKYLYLYSVICKNDDLNKALTFSSISITYIYKNSCLVSQFLYSKAYEPSLVF